MPRPRHRPGGRGWGGFARAIDRCGTSEDLSTCECVAGETNDWLRADAETPEVGQQKAAETALACCDSRSGAKKDLSGKEACGEGNYKSSTHLAFLECVLTVLTEHFCNYRNATRLDRGETHETCLMPQDVLALIRDCQKWKRSVSHSHGFSARFCGPSDWGRFPRSSWCCGGSFAERCNGAPSERHAGEASLFDGGIEAFGS